MMQHQTNRYYKNRYKFTGKELDEKTGLYDFGARHYNPSWGVWLSVDPMAHKMPKWSSYNYTFGNPVKYLDFEGLFPIETIWDIANVVYDVGSAIIDHIRGDHESAKGHWLDASIDGTAALIPYVPAGVSKLRHTNKAVDLIKGSDKITNTSKVVGKTRGSIKNVRKGSSKGSLNGTKKALMEAKSRIGLKPNQSLPKGKQGKFGSPQRGNGKKGYRLDPAHPNVKKGSGEEYPHINYWDYTKGKREKGGTSGAIPIKN